MVNEILFFISAIGVFNSFLIALYFLFKKKSDLFYTLLGLLLMFVVLRVGVSCVYFFQQNLHPSIVQVGLIAHLLSGLSLFALIRVQTTNSPKRTLIFSIAFFVVVVLFSVSYPFEDHFRVWDNKIRYYLHGIVLVFLIMSWWHFYKSLITDKPIWQNLSFLILLAYTLMCFGFGVALFVNYLLGPIIYSVIFFPILFLSLKNFKRENFSRKEKYESRKLEGSEAKEILERLNLYMTEHKPYKERKLSIRELSERVGISSHLLSQVLNDNYGSNFNTYVNEYRIQEAKQLLLSSNNLSIEGIGMEVGFSSKTTFFKVFKAQTNLTPKAFKEKSSEI